MEKTKVKQVIREALAREPAIEWYLKSKKIYSRTLSKLIINIKKQRKWNLKTLSQRSPKVEK